jgi:Flp pilus assembly protein TadB
MTSTLVLGVLFGVGALLVLASQPLGRPLPSLRKRLDALRPDRADSKAESRVRVFRTDVFEFGLRPALERAGKAISRLFSILGLDFGETEARLRSIGDSAGLTLFLGQKIASALVGLVFLPAAGSITFAPRTQVFVWLAMGTLGFVLPDVVLRAKSDSQRRRLREQLAHFMDLLSLAVSGGLGLESALDEAIDASNNDFALALRRYLREGRLREQPASGAIARMGDEMRLSEVVPLASAVASAEAHGASLSRALSAQAKAIRERRRTELIEAGEKAQTRMALPIGLLIVPAFLIAVFYPSAVQFLQIAK